jgi:hypothetical protein
MTDLKMIGGEMPEWSDRRADERPPAGGAVLAEILRRLAPAGGRILVAGPHDDALIDALGSRTEVVCLVRSEPDGARLAQRGVTVLCGTLAKVTDTDRYDLVVALDGLDRLCSVEGPQLDWAEALQVLRRALRPGGSLLLAVENDLGVHRLVDRSSPTSAHGLGAWRPVGEFDEAKPGNPTRLAAKLAADGLAVSWLAAAWPLPPAPTLLATPNALQDGPIGALSAAAAGAVGTAYAGKPVLSDPRRLAAAAVRGGLGAEFAASWIVLAHRAPRPALEFAPPPVLLGDGPVVELVHDRHGGWVRKVVSGTATPGRDAARLNGPLPTGRLLEELLLGVCLRHELPAARRLLTGWATWVGTLAADSQAAATVDNVLVDGDAHALLDPSRLGTSTGPAAALHRFAETLLAGGYAHPWASATDVDTLTAVLAGAAGLEVPVVVAAEALEKAPDSLREHEEQLRLLRQQLADATARARWFEAELSGRDAELRRTRMQIKAFSGKLSYRVAKLGAVSARKARSALRRARS